MSEGTEEQLRQIWNQGAIPVLYRRGPGNPLLARLPYALTNRPWLGSFGRKNPEWDAKAKHWELPQAWFNKLVHGCLDKFGQRLHHPALPRAGEMRAGLLGGPGRGMPMLLHGGKPRSEQPRRRLEGHIRRFRDPMGRAAPCLPAFETASLVRLAPSGREGQKPFGCDAQRCCHSVVQKTSLCARLPAIADPTLQPSDREGAHRFGFDQQGSSLPYRAFAAVASCDEPLDYLLDVVFRQSVHDRLCRVELFHEASFDAALGRERHLIPHQALVGNVGEVIGMMNERHGVPRRSHHQDATIRLY